MAGSSSTQSVSKKKISTQSIVFVGMFTAILAILSQIAIPMPTGVPVTLQTFAVALTGAILGWKLGISSAAIYILLGAFGAPVFTGFSGGLAKITGVTGGFIWGFLFMALLCGIGAALKNKIIGTIVGIGGLACCHLLGVLQFSFVSGNSILSSFLLVSAPYILKDVVSVIAAFILGSLVRSRLKNSGLLS